MGQLAHLLDQMTALYVKGDADGLADYYADDATLTVPGGSFHGRAEVRDYWAGQMAAGPDRSVELGRSVEADDLLFSEFVARGTLTGRVSLPNGTTVEPTGRRAEVRGMEMIRVAGGRVVEHILCYDLMDMLMQFGVSQT